VYDARHHPIATLSLLDPDDRQCIVDWRDALPTGEALENALQHLAQCQPSGRTTRS
jgi:hypothetical protein